MVDFQFYLDYFIELIFPRTIEILSKPTLHKNLLWIIAPLFITLILIQLYFGRYKNEELGWNTAFSNSISLLWVTTTLFRFLYEQNNSDFMGVIFLNKNKIVLILILALWAIISVILQFYHVLPKKLDFLIYSSIPVYVTSILLVILIIGNVALDLATIFASVFILLIVSGIFALIRHHIKAPRGVEISLSLRNKYKEDLRKRKIQNIKRRIKYKEIKYKNKLVNFFAKFIFWKKLKTE